MSGASVNPARTLGPALVNGNYVPEMWIYFIGPTLGASISAGIHTLMKALAYHTANPGQDGDGMEYYRLVPPSGVDTYSIRDGSYPTSPQPLRIPSNRREKKDVEEHEEVGSTSRPHARKFYMEMNCMSSGDRSMKG